MIGTGWGSTPARCLSLLCSIRFCTLDGAVLSDVSVPVK